MSSNTVISVTANDGHVFDAYVSSPATSSNKLVVIVQEIFGVNEHIRSVCDDYAQQGYTAVAPALFDRIERNVELDYDSSGRDRGIELKKQVQDEQALTDIDAVRSHLMTQLLQAADEPVYPFVVGYCWGGSLAWLAAAAHEYSAAVAYYGGQIAQDVGKLPGCPVMMHFGNLDKGIPASAVETIMAGTSATVSTTGAGSSPVQVFTYDNADHGFNCDARSTYHADSATLARERTLTFLSSNSQPET